MWRTLKEIQQCRFASYQKKTIKGALTNGKLAGVSVLNTKETLLKKIDVIFFVHVFLVKYSLSLHFFNTPLICEYCIYIS